MADTIRRQKFKKKSHGCSVGISKPNALETINKHHDCPRRPSDRYSVGPILLQRMNKMLSYRRETVLQGAL